MFNHEPQKYECPFCVFVAGGETAHNKRGDIIYETKDVVAFVSPKMWKNNPGNVLVIPRQHSENVYDIEDALLGEIYTITGSWRTCCQLRNTVQCR